MPPRSSPRRSIANRLRHAIGLRQTFTVDGVRYTETTRESLRRALSRKGSGQKEYEARFPDGSSMTIRASADRPFADLASPDALTAYTRADRLLLPGMRTLILPGGTGYAGHWAAERVAPSGAVVSLEADEQSVNYARHRYRLPNISFERGALSDLSGETDGAFDAALVVNLPDPSDASLSELWRLIAPGGWLLLAAPAATADTLLDTATPICRIDGRDTTSLTDSSDNWTSAVYRRPAEE